MLGGIIKALQMLLNSKTLWLSSLFIQISADSFVTSNAVMKRSSCYWDFEVLIREYLGFGPSVL